MTIEINIGPKLGLQIEEPSQDSGVCIAGEMIHNLDIPDLSRKIYFKVGGPRVWGIPGIENYVKDVEFPPRSEHHVTWRLPQHDRRYWQAGFQPVLGVDHPEYQYEVELTEEQATVISKYFR